MLIINHYAPYLKERFGKKVMKIGIDLGQSCPHRNRNNRDDGGCYYCNPKSFTPPESNAGFSVLRQMKRGMERCRKKYRDCLFLAYFQAYTSSMENVSTIKQAFDDVLSFQETVGISLSTRPDTFSEKMLSLLREYTQKTYVLLEIGLESVHEKSLSFLGRNHPYSDFLTIMECLKNTGIETCIHLITGIPGESKKDICASAQAMAQLPQVDGVKLHHFHVVKDTLFETQYNNGLFQLDELDETVEKVILFLEHIRSDQKVHRIIGDTNSGYLVAPLFPETKAKIRYLIESKMKKTSRFQGGKCLVL